MSTLKPGVCDRCEAGDADDEEGHSDATTLRLASSHEMEGCDASEPERVLPNVRGPMAASVAY